jgi:hypothetical protein
LIVQNWGGVPMLGQQRAHVNVTVHTPLSHIKYPPPLHDKDATLQRQSRVFNSLDADMQTVLTDAVELWRQGAASELSADDNDVIWEKRAYLRHWPDALALVLSTAPSGDWAIMAHVRTLLDDWQQPLLARDAIELLLPQYVALSVAPNCHTDTRHRSFGKQQ